MEVHMTRRAAILGAVVVGSVVVIGVGDRYGMFTDDESETLANVLKTKVSLPQALTTSEQEGQPISAKYEMGGGKLRLSVYTTKDGRFFEIIIDPKTGKIAKVQPIAEGEDLAHARAQSAALTKAKTELRDVVHQAMQDRGMRAVSVMPDMKDGRPVATVSVIMGGHGRQLKTISAPMD
jgi:hypothetical protein